MKHRILSVNGMILNAEGQRRWKINTNNCPRLTESLEQQAYDKNGEPDKTSGFDHINDAQGYFLAKQYRIIKRTMATARLGGQ
ncbi:hypothetical protein L0663_05210 [Dyadobacter sp. CY107]|uniref:phage terminase large subunit family protein n=1 Tax=Dyadobacter fanqingshengii TaxID=2906443 RepID=UPI001F410434|nr:hypothetical protein [Dyadobacter fanqingshengii]MCF2502766.1 hypothetical protein [Dyadobacter fanqingshengii]